MSGYSLDANIVIDALVGRLDAKREIDRVGLIRTWISRMAWMEVLSKGTAADVAAAKDFMGAFEIDEITADIAQRAAALRRERTRLRSPDAIILAAAQMHGRILITRNTRDFPADTPGIRIPYTFYERPV